MLQKALIAGALLGGSVYGTTLAWAPRDQARPDALVTREVSLGKWSPSWNSFDALVTADRTRAAWLTGRYGGDLVIDGVPHKGSGNVRDAVFSPDGRRLGYVSERGSYRVVVVVDGVKGDEYEWACCPAFSPDGGRVAFAAQRRGKTMLILDGKEGEPFKEIRHHTFSPDGRRVAYLARKDRLWSVVVDDIEGKGYDRIFSAPEFSPDSARVAYLTKQGRRLIAVIGDAEMAQYDSTGLPRFSPDGKRVAFAASRGVPSLSVNETPMAGGSIVSLGRGSVTKWFAVVDGKAGSEYDGPGIFGEVEAEFSPDGQHFAHVASRGPKNFVVLDGVEQKAYDEVYSVCFSPDSRQVAYAAKLGGKWLAVVGDVEGQSYEAVGAPEFSPDGTHVAYRAGAENRWKIVVDGVESREYADILSGERALAPSRLRVDPPSLGRPLGLRFLPNLGFVFASPTLLRGFVAVGAAKKGQRELLAVELEVPPVR